MATMRNHDCERRKFMMYEICITNLVVYKFVLITKFVDKFVLQIFAARSFKINDNYLN